MQTTARSLNGIDLEAFRNTVAAIDSTADLARFEFRAHSEWAGGAKTRTTISSFYGAGHEHDARRRPFVLEGDEPPVLLGSDTGPNAVEAALHALTSCLTVGFVYNAAARGIRVDSLDFDVSGTLDLRNFLGLSDDARPGYDGIEVTYRVEADAPRETIEELCRYVQRTSPMLDIITKPVPVTVRPEG